MSDLATPASPAVESQIGAENRLAPAPSPWVWMVGACLLLAGSGAVRLWQEYRYEAAFENAQTPLFPLKELPLEFGSWVSVDGDKEIPAATLKIAGSTDYLFRQYLDETTGVALQVLIVFGPAEQVFAHSPTVCFPATGFSLAEQDGPRVIPLATPARFASAVYAKPPERIECLWSFWHDGIWSADASQTKKLFRHHPEMFKVQVERLVIESEDRSQNNPSEDFLSKLLPVLQERIEASRKTAAR